MRTIRTAGVVACAALAATASAAKPSLTRPAAPLASSMGPALFQALSRHLRRTAWQPLTCCFMTSNSAAVSGPA